VQLDSFSPSEYSVRSPDESSTAIDRTLGLSDESLQFSLRSIIIINEIAISCVTPDVVIAAFATTGTPPLSFIATCFHAAIIGVFPYNSRVFQDRLWMSSDSFKNLEETERQRKVEAFEAELHRKTEGAREKVLLI
jgi:hypothetical protein